MLGERAQFVVVEVGPRCRHRFGRERFRELRDEVLVELIPVDRTARGRPPDRALKEEAVLVSLLRGAGSGPGKSAFRLYQCVGISFARSRNDIFLLM